MIGHGVGHYCSEGVGQESRVQVVPRGPMGDEEFIMVFSKNHKGISGIRGIRLQVFCSEEMDAIHFASLHLLGNVGIKVENEEAAQIYGDNGCSVRDCKEYWLVKLPQNLVEHCIQSTPSWVMAWGRDRHHDFVLEPNRVGFMPMGECLNVIDPRTREYRPAVKKDIIHWIKAIDALDGLDICPNPAFCSDVPGKTAMLHSLEAMLAHTRKPVSLTTLGGAEELNIMLKMCEAAVGEEGFRERPFLTISASPVTPLILNNHTCQRLKAAVEAGVIYRSTPMALGGGTSPITLAGTLTLTVAESLSCLVLAQLIRRGAPVVFSGFSTIMDFKSGISALGAPEHGVLAAGLTKMAQYYKLPVFTGSGGSDSKIPDTQSAYEFAISGLLAALSGSNIICGAGGLESALTSDLAKMVMDNECIHNIYSALDGITVDKENLALEIIEEMRPGGTFLDHDHTLKHFRKASRGIVFDRGSRETWLNDGAKNTVETAYQKALEIIDTSVEPLLSESAMKEIKGLIAEYEAKLKKDRAPG